MILTDKNVIAGFVIGIFMGILTAICMVDDRESFTIPLTGKTFICETTSQSAINKED